MKRKISVTLILAIIFSLSACGMSNRQSVDIDDDSQTENLTATIDENKITDAVGKVLTVPEQPQSATFASIYFVAVPFIKALDLGERALAINVGSDFWKDTDVHIASAEAKNVGGNGIDLEALAAINPTALIHRANDAKTTESVEALGIPVISIRTESIDDIIYTLNMLGKYFGVNERAEEVVAYMEEHFAMIDEIVNEIPEEEKKTAIVLGAKPGIIAGEDMLQSFMIEKAGGISLSKGYHENVNWVEVGIETIFELNPDYIFCTSSANLEYRIEELYEAPSWNAMKAVESQTIYNIPAATNSWDMPGVSCVIGSMYMLHKMHPTYFSKQELEKEIDEYYALLFGETFDAEYLGYEL